MTTLDANRSCAENDGCGCALDELTLQQAARVVRVDAPGGAPEWGAWLAEIGFLPGEPVTILARSRPGGDPLVVRIGDSTFALRRAEAACVRVDPVRPTGTKDV